MLLTNKLLDALKHEKVYKIDDYVRYVLNKGLFDKGSLSKWSTKIHMIKERKQHSYVLDNGKTYKYFQLMKVNIKPEEKLLRENEMKHIKKQNTIKRKLNQEGIELNRIMKRKRKRKTTDRLKF